MEFTTSPVVHQKRLAVLIDADNAQLAIIGNLLEEVAKYGSATVKRAYGNWTAPQLAGWKDSLLKYSIQPIQQFNYTDHKNSTDSALIIDAMDLLYAGNLDGFCIVSSDSDFTRLASRLRESGMIVYGFGEQKTPEAFVEACDKFIYTEILRAGAQDAENEPAEEPVRQVSTQELKGNTKLVNLLRNGAEDASGEDGWANLAAVGQIIQNKAPDFDSRNYGFKKLSELFRAIGLFEIEERGNAASHVKVVYVRDKRLKN
ncbi:NYN domain-containing protein [Methanocalculus sp.]|uniref:NYN domain-containing protein n=1 Tax=Methanocalculus sp. TaxID=2004547 RepID=UPI0026254F24|nr:NYN domain-containing protein [Methanocalculus sp.]MDG6249863.1 NYN domain-containing protein [Methanocalculus sp.]